MSRPVLPRELVKLHADLPRKFMRRLTKNEGSIKKPPGSLFLASSTLDAAPYGNEPNQHATHQV